MKSQFSISDSDKRLIESICEKVKAKREQMDTRIISFDGLYGLLTAAEANLIKRFLKIDPHEYGFKGKYLGVAEVPKDLVAIRGQTYLDVNETKKIGPQFLPRPVYDAYTRMNTAMQADIGDRVLVNSGYRSPAYQIVNLLAILRDYDFDLATTLSRVAMPGYSQHGYPPSQAMDVMPTKLAAGYADDLESFTRTPQYKWLKQHAVEYGFYESYPKDNDKGMIYEPWHWQYLPDKNS